MKIQRFNENNHNVNYYNKIVNNINERRRFEKLILRYLSIKENYHPAGVYVREIEIHGNEIRVYTDSNNNQFYTHYITDSNDFNEYCNNPKVYQDMKKYNL